MNKYSKIAVAAIAVTFFCLPGVGLGLSFMTSTSTEPNNAIFILVLAVGMGIAIVFAVLGATLGKQVDNAPLPPRSKISRAKLQDIEDMVNEAVRGDKNSIFGVIELLRRQAFPLADFDMYIASDLANLFFAPQTPSDVKDAIWSLRNHRVVDYEADIDDALDLGDEFPINSGPIIRTYRKTYTFLEYILKFRRDELSKLPSRYQ